MNNNINIAEILKDCPKGMKLYSPLLGNVTLEKVSISNTASIIVNDGFNTDGYFTKTGLYYDREDGECLLFPSYNMRDWTKFFKRGDVLTNQKGTKIVLFDSFTNDEYICFNGKYLCPTKLHEFISNKDLHFEFVTDLYHKIDDEDAKKYIKAAEENLVDKLDMEILKIESSRYKFKPFNKVVGRTDSGYWRIDFFEFYNVDNKYAPYQCMMDAYKECLPYNNKTAKLISTCANYK